MKLSKFFHNGLATALLKTFEPRFETVLFLGGGRGWGGVKLVGSVHHDIVTDMSHHDLIFDSKINLNTASADELAALKGVGEKMAQAIVDYREKQGKFTSVDQLEEVSGIGPATLDANRDMIIVK